MMMKTTDEKLLMEGYGITCEQKTICQYTKYQYEKLLYAINYAKLD
ncbi:MAG: hypothetical protein OQJ89_10735 [Kangiellaceae bacterium]|nr:hypothetical protein [Kangiellaceae bacterium]MCW8999471.1 hypothetical protein [Kangiellaceae bacterium]MCW9017432.1 hypothetical protein [Kangiellaceae bacterium]